MLLLRRHMSFYLAAAGAGHALLFGTLLPVAHPALIAADVFFLLYTAFALRALSKLTAERLKHYAASADAPVWIIFAVAVSTVALSMTALFVLLNQAPAVGGIELALSLIAIPLGWSTIHLMTALHYAHVFWQPHGGGDAVTPGGGLEFPGTAEPSGWDFAYFALTIGMTAQTADTAVVTTRMRRLVTLHSVLSFFFNTVIVAAAVNAAVSLGG